MYDLVVYGGTGFTGKKVAAILKESVGGKYTYAIAGRNQKKLEKVKEEVEDDSIGIIIADGGDEESISQMCAQARVLLNCVGPYRYYGEVVVKNCIKSKTHYVDVTGEPEFMEKMEHLYNEEAKAAGCIIVTGCGFDSIPADVGTVYAQKQFTEPQLCTAVEEHLSLTGKFKANFATYESAVLGVGNVGNLKKLRKERNMAKPQIPGKKPPRPRRHYNKKTGAWVVPFPGSDPSVVRRSQSYLYSNGLPSSHFRSYVKISSSTARYYSTLTGAAVVLTLASTSFGRKMLLKYPETFSGGYASKKGPTQEELDSVKFAMDFYADGYSTKELAAQNGDPDVHIHTRVSGPEPGYVATPILILDSAITLLEEAEKIKSFVKADGGVYTTAVAFYDTSLIDRLQNDGISFEVVDEE